MGTQLRNTWNDPIGVADRLASHGCRFDFLQAVWLLERYDQAGTNVGERGPVSDERISFRPDVSMGFPSTEIKCVARRETPEGTTSHVIDQTFMGLYGVSSPLPLHYAVDVIRAVESADVSDENEAQSHVDDKDAASVSGRAPVRDFLDIVNHRLVSLFYRSWLKYRFERTFQLKGRDSITNYLALLIGCPATHDRQVLGVDPLRLIRYAGVLTQRPRSATTLEGIVQDYWQGLRCCSQQCVGRWVLIEDSDQNRLGLRNTTLGEDACLGSQVYDLSGSFVLTIGPMDWETYLAFLPGETNFEQTKRLTMFYCADPLEFSFELVLKEKQAPKMLIDSSSQSPRLGYTSWLRTDEVMETSVVFDAA